MHTLIENLRLTINHLLKSNSSSYHTSIEYLCVYAVYISALI